MSTAIAYRSAHLTVFRSGELEAMAYGAEDHWMAQRTNVTAHTAPHAECCPTLWRQWLSNRDEAETAASKLCSVELLD